MTQAVRGEGGVRAYSFDIGRPDQIEVDPEVRKRLTGTTTTNTSSSPVELGDSEAIGLLRSDSMDDRVSLRYSEEEGGGDVEQGFLVAGDRETAAWRRWREECDRAFKL
ncbi:hypothetical protein HK101_006094 [Irineochytrium annulatum]|nr:hypothetical protein HK101_006094 [Irineochytrium annulatum]